jgi:paraquat-inducible protein A
VSCGTCGWLLPAEAEGASCPRCADTVHIRREGAVRRAAALTLAGVLLYIPANLYPIATLPIGLKPTHYTILEGVKDLFQAKLVGLGLLVFGASFLIPIVKLLGLCWCVASVVTRSRRFLVAKTRAYRLVEEIGAFVPVTHYNNFIYGRAEPAAVAFTGVVVVTMLAARSFDPRLMWDAAETERS